MNSAKRCETKMCFRQSCSQHSVAQPRPGVQRRATEAGAAQIHPGKRCCCQHLGFQQVYHHQPLQACGGGLSGVKGQAQRNRFPAAPAPCAALAATAPSAGPQIRVIGRESECLFTEGEMACAMFNHIHQHQRLPSPAPQ